MDVVTTTRGRPCPAPWPDAHADAKMEAASMGMATGRMARR
jgi:hypothetical protein